MKSDLFVLIIGHARSGTSVLHGLLNTSPDLNIAFEENLDILMGIRKTPLLESELPVEFNGNKIVFPSRYNIAYEDLLWCFLNKKGIVNRFFTKTAKIVFVNRNIVDSITANYMRRKLSGKSRDKNVTLGGEVDTWIKNEKIISMLKGFFSEFYEVDFYSILENHLEKSNLFRWLGVNFDERLFDKKIKIKIYGDGFLRLDRMAFYGNKYSDVKKEIMDDLSKKEF